MQCFDNDPSFSSKFFWETFERRKEKINILCQKAGLTGNITNEQKIIIILRSISERNERFELLSEIPIFNGGLKNFYEKNIQILKKYISDFYGNARYADIISQMEEVPYDPVHSTTSEESMSSDDSVSSTLPVEGSSKEDISDETPDQEDDNQKAKKTRIN